VALTADTTSAQEPEECKRVSKTDDMLGLTETRRSFLMRSLTNSVIDLSKSKQQTANVALTHASKIQTSDF